MYKYLDNIDSPSDIRGLSIDELKVLCSEIRDYMVRCCAVNPGHLGSSLGAVEIITALHYVYDTPTDKLIFDVGHQAYAHKILTGRRELFKKNRTREGISGFPKISESPYDAFGVGHASTSVSAAIGIAQALRIKKEKGKVVALIGDGAMTGGLALEGLNNAGNTDVLIIVNDNDQSIDKNLGLFHEHLMHLTTSGRYNSLKKKVWDNVGDGKLRDFLQRMTKNTKSSLVRGTGGAMFEAIGFRYFGPIDGNDIAQVVNAFQRLRNLPGPRVLHVHTTKGKGYPAAEKDPTTWHAPGKFNPETGERMVSHYPAARYQDVFGEVLNELGELDERVIGITPAMATGCGMTPFSEKFPDRFFDVGIAEEHSVTFSAGLATMGLRPYCNIYSSFSQRAYDQIVHDIALQNLPVVLCFDRAGLVGEDGATHNGCLDLAAYRSIPGAIIAAPSDERELRNMMYSGLGKFEGPYIIRYPRGCGEGVEWRGLPFETLPFGKGRQLRKGGDVAILALGPEAYRSMEAARILEKEGIEASVYDLRFLKPIDEDILREAAKCGAIVSVEEGSLLGGLFGAVTEFMATEGLSPLMHGIGVPDKFIEQDRQSAQRKECSLDGDSIAEQVRLMVERKNRSN